MIVNKKLNLSKNQQRPIELLSRKGIIILKDLNKKHSLPNVKFLFLNKKPSS